MSQALGRCRGDRGAVPVPLQHAADEEVIAPGEKSSENYQIVKGVSETESCPRAVPGGPASDVRLAWAGTERQQEGLRSWGDFQALLCFRRNKSKPGLVPGSPAQAEALACLRAHQ